MRSITLYVPHATNDGQDRPDVRAEVRRTLVVAFGGASEAYYAGSFTMADGSIVREPVTAYNVLTDDEYADEVTLALARYVKRTLAQESVLLTESTVNARFV